MRLLASVCVGRLVSRMCASARVCVRRSSCLACVCVCVRLCASVCVCLRMLANARVCVRLFTSRVPNARVCLASVSRLCASVCVGRLVSRASASVCVCVRLCASACECSRLCASVHVKGSECSRLSRVCVRLCASVVLSRVCLRLLVGTGSFYASVVIQRVQRWGELAQVFAICLASYYPLAVFYNVLMLKYPSHHLIYVFYHPMPIMPLY